jgi:AcrR family transcriptional regulator
MVWDTAGPSEVEMQSEDGAHIAADQLNAHPHPGDQTRARILQVALELIADRGYAATSTREIAERLGFTKAALYYHFRTKDDLLAALVAPVLGELEALIAEACADGSQDACRHLVVGYVDLVGRHADLIRVLASDPSVKESAGLHTAMPLFRRLVPLLAGTASPDGSQRARVRAALAAVHGALVPAQPDDDPEMLRSTAVEVACAALGLSLPDPDPDPEPSDGAVRKEYAR